MNCRDIESLILTERDGTLTEAQLASLSVHVASCPTCAEFRSDLSATISDYKAVAARIKIPDVDEAWLDLRVRLQEEKSNSPRKRPAAPVLWLAVPLAVAAAIALAFFVNRPARPTPTPSAEVAFTPPPYDPSTIAGADFVEAGDPNASTLVYVDKDSGWLVVWATDVDTKTSG